MNAVPCQNDPDPATAFIWKANSFRFRGRFDSFLRRVEGVEAFCFGGFQKLRRGGDEDDLSALKHFAGDDGGGQLQRVRPAQGGSVEKLAGGFKHGWIQRLLHHARGFKAENVERGGSVFGGDAAIPLAAAC